MLSEKAGGTRYKNHNWALAESDAYTDSFSDLAGKIRLDYAERTKWLKVAGGSFVSKSDVADKCTHYAVPNTMIVYVSKRIGIDSWWNLSPANIMRNRAEENGDRYAARNYNVVRYSPGTDSSVFKNAWTTDGIYAFAFGGHGFYNTTTATWEGYEAVSGPGFGIAPWQVRPPYRLQAVYAHACATANYYKVKVGGTTEWWLWSDHVNLPVGTSVAYLGGASMYTSPIGVNMGHSYDGYANVP
jgi:hypothetical protein